MRASRHQVLAAAGIATLEIAAAPDSPALADTAAVADAPIAELIRQSAEANSALMRGDIDRYRALIAHTDDFILMSPFGGAPTYGSDLTSERWEATRQFFRNGTLEQELVRSYSSADMAVLVTIERAHVEVGGLPAQDWSLRVTLVYRRESTEWRLAHRHADLLAKSISLEQASALARGEPASSDRT